MKVIGFLCCSNSARLRFVTEPRAPSFGGFSLYVCVCVIVCCVELYVYSSRWHALLCDNVSAARCALGDRMGTTRAMRTDMGFLVWVTRSRLSARWGWNIKMCIIRVVFFCVCCLLEYSWKWNASVRVSFGCGGVLCLIHDCRRIQCTWHWSVRTL